MNVFGGNPVWRSFRSQIRRGGRMLSGLLIGLVRCYQWTISPLLGPCCRFTPSCSHYFIGSVRKHGPFIGTLRGLWRICRCHPWSAGGHDPP